MLSKHFTITVRDSHHWTKNTGWSAQATGKNDQNHGGKKIKFDQKHGGNHKSDQNDNSEGRRRHRPTKNSRQQKMPLTGRGEVLARE